MAFDGSTGTFSRTDGTRTGSAVWNDAKTASVKIVASGHDTHDQDIADGLTNCICKDGQSTTTAVIPFASGIKTDTIAENTSATGVTIDSVLLKDGDATLNSSDTGAGIGPSLILSRDPSQAGAVNDQLGALKFLGTDDGSAEEEYARLLAYIIDPTAANPDGGLIFQTVVAGTLTSRIRIAQGLWTNGATGGDQGADTINAGAVYDDGVGPLTDYVFDMALDGTIDVAAYDQTAAPPRGSPNGPKRHKPARDYLQRYQGRAINTDSVWQFIQANRRFPNMPQAGDPRISIGEGVQKVLEICEEQAVLIEEVNQRLKAIGA